MSQHLNATPSQVDIDTLNGNLTTLSTNFSTLKSVLGSHSTDNTGTLSVPSGVRTKLSEVTLSAGTYIIVRGIDWAQNSTGRRCLYRTDGSARHYFVSQNAVNGDDTIQQFVDIEQFAVSTKIAIWGLQSSGAALTAYPYWDIVKLKS